jgi:hypothetical protein
LEAKSEANPLPNNCQKEEQARCLGAKTITIESYLGLLDEISRKEIIQIEEDDDDVLKNSEDPPGEKKLYDEESADSSYSKN